MSPPVVVTPPPHLQQGLQYLVCFGDGRWRLMPIDEARALHTSLGALLEKLPEPGR